MRLSLYQRLALSMVAIFILLMAVILWWSSYLQIKVKQEAEQRLHLSLAEHLVHDNPLLAQGNYDNEALQNLFHTLMLLGPSFEFYYIDLNGKILSYSAEPGKVKRQFIDLKPLKHLLQHPSHLPILGDDPRHADLQKIFSVAPVQVDNQTQGYLYMIIGGEVYDSVLASISSDQPLQKMAMILLLALLFLLILLLGMFRFFTIPLKKLTEDMTSFKAGNGQTKALNQWPNNSNNEIHRLGCAFTAMVAQIQQQWLQLQGLDQQRRVLLADLSHDLRTPLANLQGYIETLALNDTTLNQVDRRKFIDITLKNARILKRLVDQIFELAYLEGGQVALNNESFPLGELLHDVVAKFTLKANEKKITLHVQPVECPYHIFADIAKLERILTNLLENAIRHTPPNGQISLLVSTSDDKVRVDVRDTGVGISQKELAYIFDARYRASNSGEDKAQHAGLGLAISKKLLLLFDSDLLVQSELGKGTCFSFYLSKT